MYAAVKSNVLLRSHKGVAALFKPAAHVVQSGMPVFALLSCTAEMLATLDGRIVYRHFGEGDYEGDRGADQTAARHWLTVRQVRC